MLRYEARCSGGTKLLASRRREPCQSSTRRKACRLLPAAGGRFQRRGRALAKTCSSSGQESRPRELFAQRVQEQTHRQTHTRVSAAEQFAPRSRSISGTADSDWLSLG